MGKTIEQTSKYENIHGIHILLENSFFFGDGKQFFPFPTGFFVWIDLIDFFLYLLNTKIFAFLGYLTLIFISLIFISF